MGLTRLGFTESKFAFLEVNQDCYTFHIYTYLITFTYEIKYKCAVRCALSKPTECILYFPPRFATL